MEKRDINILIKKMDKICYTDVVEKDNSTELYEIQQIINDSDETTFEKVSNLLEDFSPIELYIALDKIEQMNRLLTQDWD